MRIPGRFWWVAALAACAAAALVVAVPAFYLYSQIPLDIELGLPLLPDVALAAALALVMLALDLVFIRTATRSLDSYRRRRRFLHGDLDALPLAVTVPTGDVPNLTDAPLVLHWRRKRSVLLSASLDVVLALMMFLYFAMAIYALAFDLTQHASTPGYLDAYALPLILFANAFIALSIILTIAYTRIRWFQWRHAFGVTATEKGLECVHATGRRTFIPWSEARLFEVEKRSHGALAPRVWRLYGSGDVATWVYHPLARGAIPAGVSDIEMKLRVDALTRLITARTGLAPRTLSKSLIEAPVISSRKLLRFAAIDALAAAFSLALAVAVVAAPLTDTPWLNIALSLPLIYAVIQLGRTVQRFRRIAGRQASHADIREDPALIISFQDDAAQGSVYALSLEPPRAGRVRRFLGGALLAVELLPGIQAILSSAATALPDAPPTLHFTLSPVTLLPFLPLGDMLASVLAIYGGLGLMLCFFVFYIHGTTIRADDLGLSMRAGTLTVTYPWNDIGEIREVVEDDKVVSYTVYNRMGGIIIGWSAHPANTAPLAHLPDAEPISPAALAQLLSQRIGGAES